jgi:hypothetical protein
MKGEYMKVKKRVLNTLVIFLCIFVISSTVYAIYCSECGARNSDDVKFCSKCGTKLGAGTKTGKTQHKKAWKQWLEAKKYEHGEVGLTIVDVKTETGFNRLVIPSNVNLSELSANLLKIEVTFEDGSQYFWYPGGAVERISSRSVPRNRQEPHVRPSTSDDCFIATATFGRPLASEVQTFRRFRDSYLLNCRIGRMLIAKYYRYGPKGAKIVRRYRLARYASLGILTPVAYALRLLMWSPAIFFVSVVVFVWSVRRLSIALLRSLRHRTATDVMEVGS